MVEIELGARLVAGAGMRNFELFRPGPAFEMRLALPHRVRGIERVILGFRTLQQIERHKAGQAVEIGFTARPDFLESVFGTLRDLESVHRYKHQSSPYECWRRLAS